MEIVLNLRDGKGWGFMESDLRHGYKHLCWSSLTSTFRILQGTY